MSGRVFDGAEVRILKKDRKSLSWLSVYTKPSDLQYLPMITKGKIAHHWLSERGRYDNHDNGKTGWLS